MKNMNKYLEEINKQESSLVIQEILEQANERNTPIISEEGINLLVQLIKLSKTNNVLEIGSAIGYSAIMMALNTCANITSIEREQENYLLAVENVRKAKLEERVFLINDDALNVKLDDCFDLIFIDAAKAQYLKFLEHFKGNLKSGGIIVCDNLLFHGLVENPEKTDSKRLKSLVKKIDNFNKELINHEEFETYIYDIGDGLSISIKK
ncbi:MAG: O-methyltransferase [Candidatus Izemoplasmatales bacterium]